SILKVVSVAAGAAFGALLTIFGWAFKTSEAPSDDGPRALVAEFLGLWIGFFLLIWSFTVEGRNLQWTLRGVAALAIVAGFGLSACFASTDEVNETSNQEPTGFKNDSTDLHL
ncbi:MAG: hypothetical protein WCA11_19195, partial [Terracidiphilus sp.]